MRLDTFLLAEAAAGHEGKLFVHGGGITRIAAPVLPWTHPQLALVIRVAVDDEDREGSHEIGVRIEDPTGAPLAPPFDFPVDVSEVTSVQGEEAFINLVLTVSPLTFGRDGIHQVSVELDGRPARTLRLPVVVHRE
jgi:hypothetical protein